MFGIPLNPLDFARWWISDGLRRAKVLGLIRDVAKAASGGAAIWCGHVLLNIGLDPKTAGPLALALGGLVFSIVLWAGTVALAWIDKSKVDTQLQVAAATGKVVPIAGIIKPAPVSVAIAAAKAGTF